ncbi:MAG: pyridoxal phosphate-dependent aminotransferase [Candidatus Omnitrophica bacterium]|nr:pyridoxal phosphate-dependent aminotransferase [Candidatus Omnitrophota bacterium]
MKLKVNSRIAQVAPSATLAITALANSLKKQGKDVVSFAAGEPDFDTPQTIKDAAIEALKKGLTKYTPSIGTVELREEISKKFKADNNLIYEVPQIAVSCGAKHSIFDAIQVLVDTNEEVIIPTPCWVSYPEMVKIAGGTPVFVTTTADSGFKITPGQFKKAITKNTKMLILNSPSNPTGMLYSKQELSDLAEICVKHNIFVISDEIYEKLIYDTTEYTSIASLGKEIYDLTITVNGVSKTYSMTGWRIGYLGASKEIVSYINNFQDHSTSNPVSMCQFATIQALREPPEVIEKMRLEFKMRRDLLMSELDKIPQISYVKPGGAFYLFCDISKLGSAHDLATRILNDVNVAMIPGEGFMAPGYVRLSFATSAERIKEGVKRIATWIEKNYNK